jgi:hypothetical protein
VNHPSWPSPRELAALSPAARRRALLGPTLAWAAGEVPYYRAAWKGRPLRLDALPLLDKPTAIAQQHRLLAGPREAFTGIVSSGTHHAEGEVLRVPRTDAELEATAALAQALGAGTGHDEGWVLELRAAHHGELGPPQAGRLVMPWTYSTQSLRLTEQLLRTRQPDGRRVVTLILGSGALMPLTSWFLSRGVNPADFGLRGLGTTSFRLAPHWRALVEETWGCPVFDNFSLSELPAPAFECERCGFHHWLLPPVLPEVLDPHTHAPLRRGTGALVVTTLAPFVTRMPLVRYWTGDLVTLGPRCPAADDVGFRARGRLAQSLVTRRDGVLVAALDVTDFLDGRPEVARHPHPMEALGLVPPGDCGAVKHALSLETRRGQVRAHVRVELRFDPLVFSAPAHALGEALAAHLLQQSPALRRLEREGRGELEVELLRPGSLPSRWAKF